MTDNLLNQRYPSEWLCLKRTVRFGETDAAGVVHFFHSFKWCHEAWEESLQKYGIVLQDIFPTTQANIRQLNIAFPVVYCEANYFKPLYVGDLISIEIHPKKRNDSSFLLQFKLKKNGQPVGITNIKHVSIDPITRERCLLSQQINLWLEESTLYS